MAAGWSSMAPLFLACIPNCILELLTPPVCLFFSFFLEGKCHFLPCILPMPSSISHLSPGVGQSCGRPLEGNRDGCEEGTPREKEKIPQTLVHITSFVRGSPCVYIAPAFSCVTSVFLSLSLFSFHSFILFFKRRGLPIRNPFHKQNTHTYSVSTQIAAPSCLLNCLSLPCPSWFV